MDEYVAAFPIAKIVGVNKEPDSCSAFAGLVQDVKEHGVRDPVIIDKETSTLIHGQARVLACKKLGMSTIPAVLGNWVPGSPEAKLLAIESDFDHKWFTVLEQGLRLFQWKQVWLQ